MVNWLLFLKACPLAADSKKMMRSCFRQRKICWKYDRITGLSSQQKIFKKVIIGDTKSRYLFKGTTHDKRT